MLRLHKSLKLLENQIKDVFILKFTYRISSVTVDFFIKMQKYWKLKFSIYT